MPVSYAAENATLPASITASAPKSPKPIRALLPAGAGHEAREPLRMSRAYTGSLPFLCGVCGHRWSVKMHCPIPIERSRKALPEYVK